MSFVHHNLDVMAEKVYSSTTNQMSGFNDYIENV